MQQILLTFSLFWPLWVLILICACLAYYCFKSKKVLLLSFLFCIITVGLYYRWGGSEGVIHQHALLQIDHSLSAIGKSEFTTEEVIHSLAQLGNTISYSHVGLAKLNQIYNQLGMPEKGLVLIEKARELAPNEKEYVEQWIYSKALLSQGRLDPEIRLAAEAFIQQHPKQLVVINLLAIDHYFLGQYPEAIAKWEFILQEDQSLTDDKKNVLHKAVQNAQHRLHRNSR